MTAPPQSYGNHRRFHPLFHFFVVPIVFINIVWSIVRLVRFPSVENGWQMIMAIALFVIAFLPRIYGLRVQNRLIRLEERIRMEAILPEDLRRRIPELTQGQIISLRFCDDQQLAELTRVVLDENLRARNEIKRRIRTWRPDNHRV